jgi:hypothetical protein
MGLFVEAEQRVVYEEKQGGLRTLNVLDAVVL